MIKVDEDVPLNTWGFFQLSIELLDISGLARIHRKSHDAIYKYARNPDRFPEGEVRQDPLRRMLIQCADVVKLGGARGQAAVRVVAAMFAALVECEVMPREAVRPDCADVPGECLDDYPPVVRLHEMIREGAPLEAVQDQFRVVVRELRETVAAYTAERGGQ